MPPPRLLQGLPAASQGAISGNEEKLSGLRIPGCLFCSFCLCAVVRFQQLCLESVPRLRRSFPADQPNFFFYFIPLLSSFSPSWFPKQILPSLRVYSFQVFQPAALIQHSPLSPLTFPLSFPTALCCWSWPVCPWDESWSWCGGTAPACSASLPLLDRRCLPRAPLGVLVPKLTAVVCW